VKRALKLTQFINENKNKKNKQTNKQKTNLNAYGRDGVHLET